MKVTQLGIDGVLLVEPTVFDDHRGFFVETWQARRYGQHGISTNFVQDNLSRSIRNVVRGLHIQHPNDQAKLVSVSEGTVYDVVVDVRVGSPTFGEWLGVELSHKNHLQLYVPEGCAHGFCVTSSVAVFAYKCSREYSVREQWGIAHDDPDIGVEWPSETPVLSARDLELPRLREIPDMQLPKYQG